MTPNKYQKEALRTESPIPWMRANDSTFRLLQGLMGLNGEAGEAIDILKKHLFQGHDLDREHLAKELGDVAWYLAVSADALGYSLEQILQMNIDKLRARYPDGFEAERSVNRKDEDVVIERWVEVRGHPDYEVSTTGQVRRAKDKKVLKQSPNYRNGAMRVALNREKYYVHRLVANSFFDGDTNCIVKHLDGDKTNNSVANLVKVAHKL